jgi:predicted dehydrogenase
MLGGAALPPEPPAPAGRRSMIGVAFEPRATVRLGMIGLGQRGMSMLPLFLRAGDGAVRVVAVCDLRTQQTAAATDLVVKAGQQAPAAYADYRPMCERDDLDFVYIATPWECHHPMAAAALRHGKHAGVETPLAMTLPDLWDLVDLSERTRRHCIQLENCCYGRTELRILRMVHEGLFGDLVHGAGAYLHDLRAGLFLDRRYPPGWRRAWHTRLRGDLYPTHGLAPIAGYLGINRGDRFVRLVSMGSAALGLDDFRRAHPPADPAVARERYVTADLCTSLLQTAQGRLVRLEHGVCNPRPYSRVNSLVGTRGTFEDYPPRIYLEPDMTGDRWGSFDAYARFDHWLWKQPVPTGTGHDGMDFVLVHRLIDTIRRGLPPDIDVYDSATWSAPIALSAGSIAAGNAPVDFPDFTRDNWHTPHPGLDSVAP